MSKKGSENCKSCRRLFQTKISFFLCFVGQLVIFLLLAFPGDYEGKEGYGARESHEFNRNRENFNWVIIPIVTMVLSQYFKLIGKGDWDTLLGAAAFFLVDMFVEIWNALFYTRTGFAAPWICNQKSSSYQVMIGWNIEIILNFLVAPVACLGLFKQFNKERAFFGINNRIFFSFMFSTTHFTIELILNYFDCLLWNYWWWSPYMPFLPYLTGYFPFYLILVSIYDCEKMSTKILVVFLLAVITIPPGALFMFWGWI